MDNITFKLLKIVIGVALIVSIAGFIAVVCFIKTSPLLGYLDKVVLSFCGMAFTVTFFASCYGMVKLKQ